MKSKSKSLLIAALVWLSVGTLSSSFAQSDSAAIRGTVVDLSGRPVGDYLFRLFVRDGQDVRSGIAYSITNTRGEFQFTSLKPGTYTVEEDFWRSEPVQLGKGDSVRLYFVDSGSGVLDVVHVSMSGRVTDSSGSAIPSVKVTATNTVTRTINSTYTTGGQSAGMYYFPDLEPGTYTVIAQSNRFETSSASVELASHASVQKNMTLLLAREVSPQNAPTSMSGRVTDASGGRVPGVVVTATNNVTRAIFNSITTDLGGFYSLPNLEPGTYTITASFALFDTFSANVELANATTVQKNITLSLARGEKRPPCPVDRVCL